MKKEEKELLLKDLCGRLPYGVRVKHKRTISVLSVNILFCIIAGGIIPRPYLRPMQSMTDEERKEYELLANHCIVTSIGFIHLEAAPLIDWLNAHHFDYRGLIPMGLGFDCTELNIY